MIIKIGSIIRWNFNTKGNFRERLFGVYFSVN